MVDDIIGIFTLALIVTALGIVVKNGTQTAQVLKVGLDGFSNIQRAAEGR